MKRFSFGCFVVLMALFVTAVPSWKPPAESKTVATVQVRDVPVYAFVQQIAEMTPPPVHSAIEKADAPVFVREVTLSLQTVNTPSTIRGPTAGVAYAQTQNPKTSTIGGVTNLLQTLDQKTPVTARQWRFDPIDKANLTCWVSPSVAFSDTGGATRVTADGSTVVFLRDLSGNANDASTSVANEGVILKTGSNGIGGMPAISFGYGGSGDPNTDTVWRRLTTPSFLDSSYNTAFTFYYVIRWAQTGTVKVVASINSGKLYGGVNAAGSNGNYTNISTSQLASTQANFGKPDDVEIVGISWDGTTRRIVTQTSQQVTTTSGNLGLSGPLVLGDYSATGRSGFNFPGIMGDALVYKNGHSAAQMQYMVRALARLYNQNLPLVVTDGNSLTYGTGATTVAVESYPAQLRALLGDGWQVINYGVVGQTTPQMSADAADQIDPGVSPYRIANLCIAWEGTNDITVNAPTATVCYNNIVSYCQARRAAGYKVVVMTLLPRNFSNFWVTADAVNVLIRANWRTFADALYDPTTYAQFDSSGDYSNTTWYDPDGIHFKRRSYALFARDLLPILQSLAGVQFVLVVPGLRWGRGRKYWRKG